MTWKRGNRAGRRWCSSFTMLAWIAAPLSTGCGYGLGNRKFGEEKGAAIAFAQALEARDTARMRQLSWGAVRSSVPSIVQNMPAVYTQFAKPKPDILTVSGGGIYGGDGEFFVPSGRLGSCRGGVRLSMIMEKDAPRVAAIRLVTPLDTLAADACRVRAKDVSS